MEKSPQPRVNNDFYRTLGERWYEAEDDPVALLRALTRLHVPWISERIGDEKKVLDVGCGAGLLSNELARRGHDVTGIDLAEPALEVAASRDRTGRVRWVAGDAADLPFSTGAFDVVCAMDVLEHVEDPSRVVGEIARVLRPGGLFFFHTLDRTPLSWLVAIKGVEIFVRNVPTDMHVLRSCVRPKELRAYCEAHDIDVDEIVGCMPRIRAPFFRMLATGCVRSDFEFAFGPHVGVTYSGVGRKRGAA